MNEREGDKTWTRQNLDRTRPKQDQTWTSVGVHEREGGGAPTQGQGEAEGHRRGLWRRCQGQAQVEFKMQNNMMHVNELKSLFTLRFMQV